MVSQALVVVLSLMTVAVANPAWDLPTLHAAYNSIQDIPIVDLGPLVETVVEMQYSLDSLVQLLEEVAQNISALAPHIIHKRQTTVSSGIKDSPGGPRGQVDVTHQSGNTRASGNINFGRGGIGWGAGIDHTTDGGWNIGGSFDRNPGGSSSGKIDFGKTWNDGNTRFGGFFGRSDGSNSGGISFSHRFRK